MLPAQLMWMLLFELSLRHPHEAAATPPRLSSHCGIELLFALTMVLLRLRRCSMSATERINMLYTARTTALACSPVSMTAHGSKSGQCLGCGQHRSSIPLTPCHVSGSSLQAPELVGSVLRVGDYSFNWNQRARPVGRPHQFLHGYLSDQSERAALTARLGFVEEDCVCARNSTGPLKPVQSSLDPERRQQRVLRPSHGLMTGAGAALGRWRP